MDARGPIPFNAAVAYGIKPNAPLKARQPSSLQPGAGATIKPPFSRAAEGEQLAVSLSSLVSGKVDSPVSRGQGFDAPQASPTGLGSNAAAGRTPTSTGPMQMYTRAADRIEVATAVTLGRTIDTRG